MTLKRLIYLIALTFVWAINIQAQYVPKKQRKNKKQQKKADQPSSSPSQASIVQNPLNQFYTIKLQKERQLTIVKPIVFCDTLIMGDESVLKVSPKLTSFTLYARYVDIGHNCLITSKGKDGKRQRRARDSGGEWGDDGVPINLYLNFQTLDHLTVNASGGNGGPGQVQGVGGSGSNIKLYYYAPFAVSFRKPKRRKRRKRSNKKQQASVFFKNKKGKPELKPNRPTPGSPMTRRSNYPGARGRVLRVYNPSSGKYTTLVDPGGDRPERHWKHNRKRIAKENELAKAKQTDGKVVFRRVPKPIVPSEVKIQ